MKRMETIVRNFCPPLNSDHPRRIEKLLNILNLKDALKLYMILPKGTINTSDLSKRSQIKPFLLDFIEDARGAMLKKENKEILEYLFKEIDKQNGAEDLERAL